MRSRTLILAAILALPLVVGAQAPVLTPNWVGTPGEFINSTLAVEKPDPGPAGEDVDWVFDNLTEDTVSVTLFYVEADTTPSFDKYPDANVCLAFPSLAIYQYSLLTTERWEQLGTTAGGLTDIVYSNPQTTLVFPLGYEDTFTDDFAFDVSFFGITVFTTGTTTATYDGYGSLTLPQGTFSDVVRVKYVNETVDSTDLGLGIFEKIISTTTLYTWFSRSNPGPLATHSVTESYQVAIVPPLPPDTMLLATETEFNWDKFASTSAVEYVPNDQFDLVIGPNPFADRLSLSFTLDKSQAMQFELQTMNGQVVHSEVVSGVAGANQVTVSVGNLPAGAYLGVLSGRETATVKKLIHIE